ncbi:hypothetical protein EDI_041430 [Entamoeba dispar SAW760]|uniref:Transmembrane protein n=1 Tax=Entamoeba dispar (strain ATCC PRA-260 / SAW760) TaxID=370354 RepID=B0ETQ3_ENTDS|nr:uncharacterized protein EDI_041430 [Entamoeba dispar SAW760]EDR22103.1 hypothetical protein EDI_041430 [Entamoeba dispar SAW760]|eukprot:EDR22103.1 hypothetical protein EDI_041430 [Entamoeba dispar SAW760]
MKVLFIAFFICCALSESFIMNLESDLNGEPVLFEVVEFDKCYFVDQEISVTFKHEGDKIKGITYSKSTSCSGKSVSEILSKGSKVWDLLCSDYSKCIVEIKPTPNYLAFGVFTGEEDDNCIQKDNVIGIYIAGGCMATEESYNKYEVDNGNLYFNSYQSNKCDDIERELHEVVGKCNVCNDGVYYHCNSGPSGESIGYSNTISVMVIFLITTLAFFA